MSTPEAWTTWTGGSMVQVPEEGYGYIWTGKTIDGKHLLTVTQPGAQEWYRLVTTQEAAAYRLMAGFPPVDAAVVSWAYKAVRMDLGRKQHLNLYTRAADDWNALNARLNEYADDKGMCEEYESTLEDWNSAFSQLQLAGRMKDYEVEVTITATFKRTIEVQATSKEAAAELVDDMDEHEVIGSLDIDDHEELSWEVDD